VGSYRAAQYICRKYRDAPLDEDEFLSESKRIIEDVLTLTNGWINTGKTDNLKKDLSEIRKRMTTAGGIIREKNSVMKASVAAHDLMNNITSNSGAASVTELADCFTLLDHCISHMVYLEAIKAYLEMGGRSRGSFIASGNESIIDPQKLKSNWKPELCRYDKDVENKILEARLKGDFVSIRLTEVKNIPKQNLWFEKVWKDFLKDI